MDLLVTLNGPGEIVGWFLPFAASFKTAFPDSRITAALLPCVFATGRERDVLLESGFCHDVWGVRQSMRAILGKRPKNAFSQNPSRSALLHLGGEPLLSLLLAKRLGLRSMAYAETRIALMKFFDAVFFASGSLLPSFDRRVFTGGGSQPRALGDTREVIGNLMVDSVRMRCGPRTQGSPEAITVGLFPGSRECQAGCMLRFFVKAVGDLAERRGPVRAVLARSPFLDPGSIAGFGKAPPRNSPLLGENFAYRDIGGRPRLITERGLEIVVSDSGRVMEEADLAFTIPGTVTAELAVMGIPMMVAVPAHGAEFFPLPGIGGHLDRLPFFGKFIKRVVVRRWLAALKFTAHPNLAAGRSVVPELTGRITAGQMAESADKLIESGLGEVSRVLLPLMGPPGAAGRLARRVAEEMTKG